MTARTVLVWLLPFAAFWPIWRWYAARIMDSPEDSCGLLALATAVVLLLRNHKSSSSVTQQLPQPKHPLGSRRRLRLRSSRPCNAQARRPVPPNFWLVSYPKNKNSQTNVIENESDQNSIRILLIVVLLLYAATYPLFPPLMRAFLGIAGVCLTVTAISPGRRVPAAVWGLFFLSLPVIPTLQFYFGYPLRRIATFLAVPFLHLAGYSVETQGTTLCWMGETVLVDAPCSGVKMMWTGFYVLCTASAVSMIRFTQTLLAGFIAIGSILAGNALRVTLLFFVETHRMPAWLHEGIGILVFLLTTLMIIWSVRWIANYERLPQPMYSHV